MRRRVRIHDTLGRDAVSTIRATGCRSISSRPLAAPVLCAVLVALLGCAGVTEAQVVLDQESVIRKRLPEQRARLAALQQRADAAGLTENVYIDCGLYIAERYLQRVAGERDTPQWKVQQLDEIEYVLTETEALMQSVIGGKAPPLAVPRPTGGPVTIKDGRFLTEVRLPGGKPYVSPYYFYGYGHWSQAAKDIPNFRRLGVTLIQQTKAPAWAMSREGTYIGGSLTGNMKCPLDLAQQHRMKVDMLLEQHYFPDWAFEAAPEMRLAKAGFIKYNIDHPVARRISKSFVQGVLAAIKDKPALFSVCLSNEPSYSASGRDKYSRPLYLAFLEERHGTIEQLNELYETDYRGFDAIQVPDSKADDVAGRRALYDWATFNRKHFLDWHEWLNGLVKKVAPNVLTHTKTIFMVHDQEEAALHAYDPERMSAITDIAGLDAVAYVYGNEHAPTSGRFYSSDYAFDWSGQALGNDFHHSIKGAPVFDSEHHVIPSRITTAYPVPPQHTRAVLWQGALHHMGACTIWVWHEAPPTHLGLQGSIYFRPANIYAASRAMLDLNRLAEQVSAVSGQEPRVALLYSHASVYWDKEFFSDLLDAYVALTFMGEPVGFVTERQLAAGTFRDYKWIIVPNVPAVRRSTVAGLREYIKRGAKVILYGDKCLTRDEYWRGLPAGSTPEQAVRVAHQETARRLAAQLDGVFGGGGLKRVALLDTRTGGPAWGVDYRVVRRTGAPTLVSALNVFNKPIKVALDMPGQAIDLVTGGRRDLESIPLDPMEFVLLEVTSTDEGER